MLPSFKGGRAKEVIRAYNLGRSKLGKLFYRLQEYGEKVKYNSAQFRDGMIAGLARGGRKLEISLRGEDEMGKDPVSWADKALVRNSNRIVGANEEGVCDEYNLRESHNSGSLLGVRIAVYSFGSAWAIDALLELPKIYRKKKEDKKGVVNSTP